MKDNITREELLQKRQELVKEIEEWEASGRPRKAFINANIESIKAIDYVLSLMK